MKNRNYDIETIINSLDQILNGNHKIHIDIDPQSELREIAEKINNISDDLLLSFSAVKKISQGDFSSEIRGTRGIAASLKTVQANIRHLIWQCKKAADGDLSQKILPMGNLSEGFNSMVTSLKNARDELTDLNLNLENKVKEKTAQLKKTYLDVIHALAFAIDEKDPYTHDHSKNVARYAIAIGKEMGLSEEEINIIERASLLHDLGKIGTPDYILTKPGKLSPQEWEEIKQHPLKGAKILEPLEFLNGESKLILQHHERFDGKGYPNGIKGKSISLGARIIAIADSFDAMIRERSYRKALTNQETITKLKKGAGMQFDPEVVFAVLSVLRKMK